MCFLPVQECLWAESHGSFSMHLKILHIRDYVIIEKDYIARNYYTASSVLVSNDSDSECDTCSRLQGEVLVIIVAAELGRCCSCC